MNVAIHVQGLGEFVRALRAADKALPRELRRLLNEAAEDLAEEASARAERQFKLPATQRTGRLVKSIKPASTQREGRVKMGTPTRVPYAGWWEFGGKRPRPRPRVTAGRALYPALVDQRESLAEKMDDLVGDLVKRIELS